MQKGLTEEKIAQLENYEDSPAFTPREKSAIRFAEKLAIDYDSIDNDEFFIGLQRHFSDAEIVELGIVIGYDIAFGRLLRVFDADPKVCGIPAHNEVGIGAAQQAASAVSEQVSAAK